MSSPQKSCRPYLIKCPLKSTEARATLLLCPLGRLFSNEEQILVSHRNNYSCTFRNEFSVHHYQLSLKPLRSIFHDSCSKDYAPSCERLTAGRREPEAMMLMRQRVTVYYHSDQRMCSSKGDPFLDSRHLDHLRTVITTEQHNFLLLLKNKRQWTITEF